MQTYNGGLTREQFLLYEIRVVARLQLDGLTREEIMEKLKEENLFQFSLSKNFTNALVSCIIKETGVFLWNNGEKMHGRKQS